MLFNTFQFVFFFIVVFGLYLNLNRRWQNLMLLIASYIFYSAWDWRFLSLILISTVLDYFCGLRIHEAREPRRRRFFLFLSVFGNLSILGFFKYYNFFVSNLDRLLRVIGLQVPLPVLDIILPLGISFYTLQSLSYTIDIYRKGLKPTRSFLDFALFVTFFPQLVAGPIERARNLLPQILEDRRLTFEKFSQGFFLFFWGLFMKVFIADNLALVVDPVFDKMPPYNGLAALLAGYGFTFQIFCDFAGYSNMAIGLGKMMGFEIMQNFNLPYLVPNIQEFWNRWHISLSTWVRDYLYVPIFFKLRQIKQNQVRIGVVLLITMAIMGLWHGANNVFILWGLYHGILLVLNMLIRTYAHNWINPKSRAGQFAWTAVRIIFVFHLVMLGMLVFRCQWAGQAIEFIKAMIFNMHWFEGAEVMIRKMAFYTWLLSLVQIFQYAKKDLLVVLKAPTWIRAGFYYVTFMLLFFYGATGGQEFIYFQF